MFTATLFLLPLLCQVTNSKFFIAEVEGADVEMPQFKPFQTSPSVEKVEEATSSGIKSGSGSFGKVEKVAEHGNDYNDYGSFFMGDSSKLKTKKSRTYNKRKKGWRCGIHETDDENVRMDFGKCSHPLICNRDDDRCITKEQAEKNFIKNGRKVVGG